MENTIESQKKERVIAYIDGFNLYFGIKEAGLENCKWLDLKKLVLDLLKPNQLLVDVKYFTSRVSNAPDKQKRQATYIEAVEASGVTIFFGHYQSSTITCKNCFATWATYNEKMTDVNIATQIMVDAYADNYDMAFLISGDSDLVPPIRLVHELFKNKRVFVAFPPKRHSHSVSFVAKGSISIGRKKLVDAQFAEKVTKKDGYELSKPFDWK